jgi:hypothetical protein
MLRLGKRFLAIEGIAESKLARGTSDGGQGEAGRDGQ